MLDLTVILFFIFIINKFNKSVKKFLSSLEQYGLFGYYVNQ